jgi:hypothetical protein
LLGKPRRTKVRLIFQIVDSERVEEAVSTFLFGVCTQARLPIGALPLSQTEVHQYTMPLGVVVQEVCGLDIPMQDAGFVNLSQTTEQASEIVSHIVDQEVSIV